MSTLSPRKIDKYEEMLPSNQIQIIKQAKFAYFLLGKAFETK